MIQINLLPSVKAEYVKAQRSKRTVVVMSIIVSCVAVGVVALLASVVYGAQALQLRNLDKSIDKQVSAIKDVSDLDKILTIQNQLNALTPLHDAKPVMSRLYTYIQQTTPAEVKINSYKVNNEDYSITIDGGAPSIELVNKYVDTLKFTEIKQTDENAGTVYAFKEVVLSSFQKSENEYSYTINLKFNDQLFSSASDVVLVVPSITTTRSQTQLPSSDVFAPSSDPDQSGGEQ